MIWHAINWGLLLSLLGLWSLGCWMAGSVLSWEGWSQGLDWAAEVARMEMPAWLSRWLGLEWIGWLRELLVEFGPAIRDFFTGLPGLGSWLTLALWIVWGLGAAALLAVGALISLVIALMRRPQNSRP